MNRLLLLLCTSLLLLTASCEDRLTLADAQIIMDTPFELRPPQKAQSADLSIVVLQVLDSRCPQDVVCVWEGEVAVKLQVSNEQESDELLLTLHRPEEDGRNEAVWGDFLLRLEWVSMPPGHQANWKTEDYTLRLQVSRL